MQVKVYIYQVLTLFYRLQKWLTKSAQIDQAAIRATTLEAAIASGGSTCVTMLARQNEGGYFQHHFNVYERANEPCFSCSKMIQSWVQAGRATYWCAVSAIRKKLRKNARVFGLWALWKKIFGL
jgi:hypothetical protein